MASSRLPIVGFGGRGGSEGGDGPAAGVGEADAGSTALSLSDCPCGRELVRGLKGLQHLGDGEDGSSPD